MPRYNLLSIFHWSVTLVGVGLLAYAATSQPVPALSPLIIALLAATITVLVLFPVEIFLGEVFLLNAIALPAVLFFGFLQTGIALILGILSGFLIIKLYLEIRQRAGARRTLKQSFWSQAGFLSGSLLIPLAAVYFILGTPSPARQPADIQQSWLTLITMAGILFLLVHAGLVLLEKRIRLNKDSLWQANDLVSLLFVELLPLPVALLSILTLPLAEPARIYLLIGSLLISVAIIANRLSVPRSLLERRARELSTLNQISSTLSSTSDLDTLLESLQIQVTQVLNVDNFYIALYDFEEKQIWYPLAVKHGQRQVWSRRALTDRLTDRVIQLREPILLPHHARQELARIGLPTSEDAPYAWVGVPLVTSERVIGCMAVFSYFADTEFTKADLNLLTILAGQASVAIEIALHNALLSSDVTIGRDRLSAVLNSVNEGIILIEENGRVTLVNEAAARITHFPRSDFIGRRLTELSTPVLQAIGLSLEQANTLLAGANHQEFNESPYTYQSADRNPAQVLERTLVPVASKPGSLTGWLFVLRDVTEEQHIQAERDLISETLVHDLRSPIGAVLAALDVVSESVESGGPKDIIRSSVGIAQRSARRVLELVESMLEIARLQSGNFSLDLEPVALKPFIAHTLLDFSIQASEYGISLHNNLPDNLPDVSIDPGKIQRVFNNLIDNALKFTGERGSICLEADTSIHNEVFVKVVDTGPGIPEEFREKVFERFTQVPGRTSRRRGSGLGLAYCRLAIEAHGGKIWVESNHPQGSVFCFTLPLATPE